MAGITVYRAQTHLLHTLPRFPHRPLYTGMVAPSDEREAGASQHTPILCLVLARRRVMSQRRRHDDFTTNVPEYTANSTTESAVATLG